MDVDSHTIFIKIVTIVFPLVAIVVVGCLYAKRKHTDFSAANSANIDVFIPALIFSVLSEKSFDLSAYQGLAVAAVAVIIGSGVLALPACKIFGIQRKTLLPPMMFNNAGNLGLPLAVLAFGESALPAAVVLFLVENTLHFSLGMFMLDRRNSPLKIIKMPVILASVAGVAWSVFELPLPGVVRFAIDMLAQISIPLMLFALGVRMTTVDLRHWRIGVMGAILRPLCGVAVALLVIEWMQLGGQQAKYLLLFSALPPAVLNYMIAERFQQQPQEVAAIVLIGNMASLAVIPLVLYVVL